MVPELVDLALPRVPAMVFTSWGTVRSREACVPWGQMRWPKTTWEAPESDLKWPWSSDMKTYICNNNLGAIFPRTLKGKFWTSEKIAFIHVANTLSTYHLLSTLRSTWYFHSNIKMPHKVGTVYKAYSVLTMKRPWTTHRGGEPFFFQEPFGYL